MRTLRTSAFCCVARGLATLLAIGAAAAASAQTSYKQTSFHEVQVFSGLVNPTAVRFLPDGSVLVAEKSGLIKKFDTLTSTTPSIVADFRTAVHNFWDRGLLGLAIDPNFSSNHFVYVLYTYNAIPGGAAPRWVASGGDPTSDPCPTPPGATTDGCVVQGHLSRLTAVGTSWTASEQILIQDWCQQFPSHSVGSMAFGADGMLYVTGGEGASFDNADWGQFGGTQGVPPVTPANPCGDPPFPATNPETKPTAEGGALRAQSPRRTPGEPRVLNGSLLRLDPATGAAAPGNPMGGSGDPDEQRIIGFGFRNPFRMIVKPGTNDVWVADVGWNTWEEINRVPDHSVARNFGWPCFEGNSTQYTGLNICPTQAQTTAPYFLYNHGAQVTAGDGCPTGSSSVAGMAFYGGASNYPSSYNNALFFSDYSRHCVWVMLPGTGGDPNPANVIPFASGAQGPVDLQIGPDGNVYYSDFDGGKIWRIEYGPIAVASGNPTGGPTPLTVNFSSTGSLPAQPGDTITYAWDLDGDGQYDDSTLPNP
ncbi:MAG TPA: PQQ-dependent sugar dehydrogenase, partial [Polyangiaceae bacterium]